MRPPIVWIVVVFVAATLIASVGLLGLQVQLGFGVFPLVTLAPGVAAAVTWAVFQRRLEAVLPTAVPRRQWIAHTILGVGASILFAAVVWSVWAGSGHAVAGGGAAASMPLAVVLLLVGAAGEELGWRGLLQPVLERRMSRVLACVVTGVLWGLWHVQVLQDAALAVVFLLGTIALSLLLGHLATSTWWQRAVTATIVHWLVNVALFVIAGDATGGFDATLASTVGGVVAAVVFLGMFAVAQRRRAARRAATARDEDALHTA